MHRFLRAAPAFAVVLSFAGTRAAAQSPSNEPAYLAALTLPPSSVGTCLPALAAGRDSVAGELRGHRLVMTSRSPGGRREMTVYTDRVGRVRSYVESIHRMTGATTGAGESVIAAMTPDGRVSGLLVRTTVAMEAPAASRVDTAALRAMREQATTTQARDTLGVREQARVRAAAAWLLRRCAA